jgi:glycosyltransferase involved in cell wall biosynthesis
MERFDPENMDRQQLDHLKSGFDLQGKHVVTSVGRITELKDYETFIRAVAEAIKSNSEIRGLIVGNVRADKQDYYTRLQQLVSELRMERHIHFTTQCTCMPELYALSDVVVSCSKKPESFGLTLIEALAMNTPVIATRHGGPLDIIKEGGNGCFYEKGDVKELARLIIGHGIPKRDFRSDIAQRFSVEKMIESTLSVYQEAIDHD